MCWPQRIYISKDEYYLTMAPLRLQAPSTFSAILCHPPDHVTPSFLLQPMTPAKPTAIALPPARRDVLLLDAKHNRLNAGPKARMADAFEESRRIKMPWVDSALVQSRFTRYPY